MSSCVSHGSASAARDRKLKGWRRDRRSPMIAGMSAAYCLAAPKHPLHGPYHDGEYGFPAEDEAVLFERLVLEINQAGLSWQTVLRKRPAFRAAFADYEVDRVAGFGEPEVARLLADPGIVRNRQKIAAVIDNARRIQQL